MRPSDLPLLRHALGAPSAFTPESLIAAVRAERNLSREPAPPICVLEFDGDLTDWLASTGAARPLRSWACFHTAMYGIDVDGTTCGVVPRTIGGSYSVLVAEQLRASGARVVLGLTSAGRVGRSLPLPSIVIATEAIRDEGTSYHYLPGGPLVAADPQLAEALAIGLRDCGLPVFRGPVWTTDAPYRETHEQFAEHAEAGVLAVEMQAASLFAFAAAMRMPVGVVAHVTNSVDHAEESFNKGSHEFGQKLLLAMCRAAKTYLGQATSATRPANLR